MSSDAIRARSSSEETNPCLHIPLSNGGETLQSFYRTGTHQETEQAPGAWLRTTIRRLEAEKTGLKELRETSAV
jgi:hypothetical protein